MLKRIQKAAGSQLASLPTGKDNDPVVVQDDSTILSPNQYGVGMIKAPMSAR